MGSGNRLRSNMLKRRLTDCDHLRLREAGARPWGGASSLAGPRKSGFTRIAGMSLYQTVAAQRLPSGSLDTVDGGAGRPHRCSASDGVSVIRLGRRLRKTLLRYGLPAAVIVIGLIWAAVTVISSG